MIKNKVSIIVPYFNSALFVERLIKSIKNQEYGNFQCILVDDGSEDNSFDIVNKLIAEDKRFINVRRKEGYLPGGRGAKNYGFTLSDGEFIVFFDSDDVMYLNYLSSRVCYLKKNLDRDAVVSAYGLSVKIGEKKKKIYRLNPYLFKDFTGNLKQEWFWLNYIDRRFWFTPGNVMWRRSSIENKPMWDETTSICEDHEYHARLILQGLNIGFIDDITWDYMFNPLSMIVTSEAIKPLLSRSYVAKLVIRNILKSLGYRKPLISKELVWQVRYLQRIVDCKSGNDEKDEAIKIMLSRILELMKLLEYSPIKRGFLISWLWTTAQVHKITGIGNTLYKLLIRDKYPTEENIYSAIS